MGVAALSRGLMNAHSRRDEQGPGDFDRGRHLGENHDSDDAGGRGQQGQHQREGRARQPRHRELIADVGDHRRRDADADPGEDQLRFAEHRNHFGDADRHRDNQRDQHRRGQEVDPASRRRSTLPLHPGTNGLINDYLDAVGHALDEAGPLLRPVRNNHTGRLEGAITADSVYRLVRRYSGQLGFLIGAHALRATEATNALDHQADIAEVQEWLGHANIATTYDHRRTRPEDSPTFKVAY